MFPLIKKEPEQQTKPAAKPKKQAKPVQSLREKSSFQTVVNSVRPTLRPLASSQRPTPKQMDDLAQWTVKARLSKQQQLSDSLNSLKRHCIHQDKSNATAEGTGRVSGLGEQGDHFFYEVLYTCKLCGGTWKDYNHHNVK